MFFRNKFNILKRYYRDIEKKTNSRTGTIQKNQQNQEQEREVHII